MLLFLTLIKLKESQLSFFLLFILVEKKKLSNFVAELIYNSNEDFTRTYTTKHLVTCSI